MLRFKTSTLLILKQKTQQTLGKLLDRSLYYSMVIIINTPSPNIKR